MEHTKLKVGERANGFREIVDEETGGRLFYETVQTLDRAKRIVKCWNERDGLVEALQKIWDGGGSPKSDFYHRIAKQALAAAEEANDE